MMRHCLVLRAEKTSPGEEDPYAKVLYVFSKIYNMRWYVEL